MGKNAQGANNASKQKRGKSVGAADQINNSNKLIAQGNEGEIQKSQQNSNNNDLNKQGDSDGKYTDKSNLFTVAPAESNLQT